MKKLLIAIAIVFLFTGCDVKEVTKADIEETVEIALNKKIQGANNNFAGYKFYLPRGTYLESKKENNYELLYNGEKYYLYVDVISYFHKKEIETSFDKKLYFSKKIAYNNINGYIRVSMPEDNVYFMEIVYNYSKIEAYVKEGSLISGIENSLRILSSIEYNDVILNSIIGDKALDYKEETYNFFESKREEGNFLDYIEEYDTYDEDKIKDDDVIDLND